MPQRTATIESLPMAFEVVTEMQAGGLEWSEGYGPPGRRALAEIIEGRLGDIAGQVAESSNQFRFQAILCRPLVSIVEPSMSGD